MKQWKKLKIILLLEDYRSVFRMKINGEDGEVKEKPVNAKG